jgi:hypothetical protein
MRFLFVLIIIACLGLGSWYALKHGDQVLRLMPINVASGEFQTLEIRHPADEIMQNHKRELLKNQSYTFLETKLLFHPYLLMDVKFAKPQGGTEEGVLLWGLHDGEMVIKTASWETSHGFEDCLIARANSNDLKIIAALNELGGSAEKEKLYAFFKIEPETMDKWIEHCRSKKLIVMQQQTLRLHLQNHRLVSNPITHFDQQLVAQPAMPAHRIKGKYSISQIKNLAQMAFGSAFAIRRTEEIYLPVYAIPVQNPDGSILTTYWNALNGQRIDF